MKGYLKTDFWSKNSLKFGLCHSLRGDKEDEVEKLQDRS